MDERKKALIEEAAKAQGLTIDGWVDEEGAIAVLGRWQPVEDDDERGMYTDQPGELSATVVGAPEYYNERVCFTFTNEGFDRFSGDEVRYPLDELEPAN